MARDRDRHAEGRRGSSTASPDDMPPRAGLAKAARLGPDRTLTAQQDRPGDRRQDDQKSLEDRIANALRVVAELLEHDEAYLPIFLRLEAERDKAAARRAALDRARAVLRETPPRSRSGPAPRP